jgi:spore coat protein CotH
MRPRALSLLSPLLATALACSFSDPVDPTEWLFDPQRVLDVRVEMAAPDWEQLRFQRRDPDELLVGDCLAGPKESPFVHFPARLTIDGETVDQVGVRKKGFLGSASLSKPSLRFKINEYVDGQRLSGANRITLNNSRQDRAYVKQCLVYQLFAAAGLAAPRCNFAHVTVNDRPMGIYVHVEPIRGPLFERHFGDHDAPRFEGQLSDFRRGWADTFEAKNTAADRALIDAVVEALELPDADLLAAVEAVVDVDTFLTFWAMEALTGHWDGYANNQNNFYFTFPPETGRLTFIPWGPDIAFETPDPFTRGERPASVSAKGMLAYRLYALPEIRARYVERMRALLVQVWHEDAILAELDRLESLLSPHVGDAAASFAAGIAEIRAYVSDRRPLIEAELDAGGADWDLPLRDDPCMHPVGTVTGTFAATWDPSGEGNPFAGSGTLSFELAGATIEPGFVGAAAGPDDGALGARDAIQVVGLEGSDLYAVALLLDPEIFEAGTDTWFDWGSAFGVLVQPSGDDDFELLGLFNKGRLILDQAGRAAGDPVVGSFEAELVSGLFE